MPKQVFYHFRELEEHEHGMWRIVPVNEREGLIEAARFLMADPEAFRTAMLSAVMDWPKSVEAAMTTPGLNRRAWMGHAGCCIAAGSSEDLTRLGWHRLTEAQQDLANAAADDAIEAWENAYLSPPGSLWNA